MEIKHDFISQKTDGTDSTQVQPSNWNANHVFDEIPSGSKIRIPVLIESKTLAAGTTTTTFSNLNGDVDGEYLLRGVNIIFASSGSSEYSLMAQFNGDTTASNYVSKRKYFGAAEGIQTLAFFLLVNNIGGTGSTGFFEAQIFPKTGVQRIGFSKGVGYSPGDQYSVLASCKWTNTTDNITAMTIATNGSSFSGTLNLYKMITITL